MVYIPPPPTRFGPAPLQAQATSPTKPAGHLPPPTRYGAAPAQPKAPLPRPGAAPVQPKAPPLRPGAAPVQPKAPPPAHQGTAPAQPKLPPAAQPPVHPLPQPGIAALQCRLSQNALGQWVAAGRVSGHSSAANRRALSAKIRMRDAGAVTNWRAVNNDHETNLLNSTAGTGDFIRGNLRVNNLAICHKMSSESIQQTIATAANTGNWAPVRAMVDGIQNSGWTDPLSGAYEANFDVQVNLHYTQADLLLNNLSTTPTLVTATNLNRLAGLIANSPANLFVGNDTINSSIQEDGDYNSFPIAMTITYPYGAVRNRRRMTLDSRSIYTQLTGLPGGIPGALRPVSHGQGLVSTPGSYRRTRATFFSAAALANTNLTSSADPLDGYGSF